MKTETNYTQQAQEFLNKVGGSITINYLTCDYHFAGDKEMRNIYTVTIKRNGQKYSFKFGDSINNTDKGIKPTIYDVLACLTKQDFADFNDFCESFGYSEDSITALKTFKAVQREFKGVNRVFGDVMEQLQDIQ